MFLKIVRPTKLEASTMFKLSQPDRSLQLRCLDVCNCLDLSNNSATKTGSSYKYQLNYGMRLDSEVSDVPRGRSRTRTSGTNYLKHLPTVLARHRDTIRNEEDQSPRDAFPEAASVSLPTSTTTLDYLLHRRSSRATIDETPEDDGRETNSQIRPRGMIKAYSASDASSLTSSRVSEHIASQMLSVEPCLYTYQVMARVAKILDLLQSDNGSKRSRKNNTDSLEDDDESFMMNYEDDQEQTKIFELTFTVLKFQKLLQEALAQTSFFIDYSIFNKYSNLVNVILYDLQSRKFQRRLDFFGEQAKTLGREIENALISRKTRLQSFIAKERIKHNAPSIDYLLPESLRKVDQAKSKIPVYFWVNQLKTSLEAITTELETEGFVKLEDGQDIIDVTGKMFQLDRHCSDLLIFPSALGTYLRGTNWVKMGHLVQQDKTSCLAAESVQYLLGTSKDVIHINVGPGITTAHLASLLKKKSPHSHIWGFGFESLNKIKKAIQNIELLGAGKNVDPEEARLKSVKVILITANCSKSGIANPIQFVISEKEDMRCLGDLFKASQGVDNMASLVLDHGRILKHALSFPRVHSVVYATRSRHQAENEAVVTMALEYNHATNANKGIPFRVTPPVLPFTFDEINSGSSGVNDKYLKFLSSESSNGCFVAVISREPDNFRNSARSSIPVPRSNELLRKSKSLASPIEVGSMNVQTPGAAEKKRKQLKTGKKKLKKAVSTPEVKVGIRSKLAGHKSAAAFGARLYQVDLVQKMEQRAKLQSIKLEHTQPILQSAGSFSALSESEISSPEW